MEARKAHVSARFAASGREAGGARRSGRFGGAEAIGERLGGVDPGEAACAVEIGDCAGDFEDAMIGAGRDGELLGGLGEKRACAGVELADCFDFGGRRIGVDGRRLRQCLRWEAAGSGDGVR